MNPQVAATNSPGGGHACATAYNSQFFLKASLMRRFSLLLMFTAALTAAEPVVITLDQAETAQLDPAQWSKSFPGERSYDALRPLLVRFPGAAEAIQAKLAAGHALEKVELRLEWDKQEGKNPQRGRSGWGSEEAYTKNPGLWSVEARAVLQPWTAADPALAPTADAWLPGGFWTLPCGRADGSDRGARVAGPLPLNPQSTSASLDLTPLFADPAWGTDAGARLRAFAERGVQLLKPELFDISYNSQEGGWFDVYAWRVPTGYMRVWVKPPQLVVTLRPDASSTAAALPPASDLAALAAGLQAKPQGRRASAPPDGWKEAAERLSAKPADMPDWMWQRVQELRAIGGWRLGRVDVAPFLSGDPAQLDKALTEMLKEPPHYWDGHLTSDHALFAAAFAGITTPAHLDHLRLYWTAWLHPETADCENPRLRSYFRQYNWTMGTQNFSTNSIASSYLGGEFLKSQNVLADARWGVENFLLRCWGFYNGANQEAGDTYYQALSVAGLQIIAKYAQDPVYRLMGRIASERQVEQLISAYNAGLRRITYPMGRGELKYQLLMQDGPYHAVHSLSQQGALIDLPLAGKEKHHVPVIGGEGPPGRYATLAPWGPAEWSGIVDAKRFPWSVHARDWHLGDDKGPSGWTVHDLGRHWTLASRSNRTGYSGVTPVTAQWRRADRQVETMEELSTLQMSFGINGVFLQSMITAAAVQKNGKLIAMSPLPPRRSMTTPPNPDYAGGWRAKDPNYNPKSYNALHASLAVMTFGDVAEREVWIGGRKEEKLSGASSPANPDPKYAWERSLVTTGKNSVWAKEREPILIKDGVSYLALIPLVTDPLPREQEVEVAYEWPVLYVNNFLYRGAEGLDLDRWYGAKRKAGAGFVIEMGDESQYGSFDAFRAHIATSVLTVGRDEVKDCASINWQSGDDNLSLGYRPWDMGAALTDGDGPIWQQINGREGYLAAGIQRDSPWSQQGDGGRLEKNGAVLESEPGHRTYLLAEPESGFVTAFNPIPDPIFWRLTLGGGVQVRADGRVGLLRLRAQPGGKGFEIDHQLKPDQTKLPGLASSLVFTGLAAKPQLSLNGKPAEAVAISLDGKPAWALPLTAGADATGAPTRLAAADATWAAVVKAGAPAVFRDWWVVGPFDNQDYAGQNFQLKDFGPEAGFDPAKSYTGIKPGEKGVEPAELRWKPLLAAGEAPSSPEPAQLLGRMQPDRGACAYLAATIRSEREQTVWLLTGSDERLGLWLNGEKLLWLRGYRLHYRDQDRTPITLKQGDNRILVKLSHGHEQWRFSCRLADADGLPSSGVVWVGAHASDNQPGKATP